MPRKPKAIPRDLPTIPKELIDQFVKGPMTAEAVQEVAASLPIHPSAGTGAKRHDISHRDGFVVGWARW